MFSIIGLIEMRKAPNYFFGTEATSFQVLDSRDKLRINNLSTCTSLDLRRMGRLFCNTKNILLIWHSALYGSSPIMTHQIAAAWQWWALRCESEILPSQRGRQRWGERSPTRHRTVTEQRHQSAQDPFKLQGNFHNALSWSLKKQHA